VPDAALVQAGLLLGLLEPVVAGLEQRLQVGLIPEQTRVATMRRLWSHTNSEVLPST
jgi:hypothetical protein